MREVLWKSLVQQQENEMKNAKRTTLSPLLLVEPGEFFILYYKIQLFDRILLYGYLRK